MLVRFCIAINPSPLLSFYFLLSKKLARAILSLWWTEGTRGLSADDARIASDALAAPNSTTNGRSSSSNISSSRISSRWQELLTENVTVTAPVELDDSAYCCCTEAARFASGDGSAEDSESKERVILDESTDERDKQKGGAAAATSGVKTEIVGDRNAADYDSREEEVEEEMVVPRAAERKLNGWEAVQAEAERMRIARETLGHSTAVGNLRLEVEVHVSAFFVRIGVWVHASITYFSHSEWYVIPS